MRRLKSPQQQIEIAVTRQQDDAIHVRRRGETIDRDPNVPVALSGAIFTLYIRFQLYVKANMRQRRLKFDLPRIATINGVRGGLFNPPHQLETLPEFTIVKLPTVPIPCRVVDVLHINENRQLLHREIQSILL